MKQVFRPKLVLTSELHILVDGKTTGDGQQNNTDQNKTKLICLQS